MKYIEELSYGDCFLYKEHVYLLTNDFNNKNQKLCYNLAIGSAHWLRNDATVEICPVYRLDKENNIYPIKEYKNDKSNNIH
jgi:hypothetical protein